MLKNEDNNNKSMKIDDIMETTSDKDTRGTTAATKPQQSSESDLQRKDSSDSTDGKAKTSTKLLERKSSTSRRATIELTESAQRTSSFIKIKKRRIQMGKRMKE